jgi:hypothetical protein
VSPSKTVDRNAGAMKCECGGYMDRVDCTAEERKKFGCSRDRTGGWECCARAFVCCICKLRHACWAEAPEMD